MLGIDADPVTIKQVEVEIIDRAFASGWVVPRPPAARSGRTVAVIGSGPAGLAAAQQLTRAGHAVTVFERDDAPGGLLRYGIPEFKLEKRHLDRRLDQMRAEGTEFRCGVEAGTDVSAETLRASYDAIVLAGGARVARDLPMPGRELAGIHQAMEYLPLANRVVAAESARRDTRPGQQSRDTRPGQQARRTRPSAPAAGTWSSSAAATPERTAWAPTHRQGAASVTQLEILPRPPAARPGHQPWPTYPMIYRVSSAHEEGGDRAYAVSTLEFLGDEQGRVRALRVAEADGFDPVPGTERELPCDLVLLAMGFTGAERPGLLTELGVDFDARGNVGRDAQYATSVPGVFTAGDMGRGQSLIVWAIAEGRSAAAAVDRYLGGTSHLPAPIPPTARPLT